MKVRAKKSGQCNLALQRRTNMSLTYALSTLQNSEISPFIKHVYLYGSCARREQQYNSDVDILVELADDTDIEKYRSAVIGLKGKVSPLDLNLPIVDMHVVVGSEWKDNTLLYYKNVKRDGVDVWESQGQHI